MRQFPFCVALVFPFFASCAHSPFQGSVTEKVSDDEAEVHLTGGEPVPGEKVEFFNSKCRSVGGRSEREHCKRVPAGEGKVIKPLSKHDALVHLPAHSQIAKGTYAEVKKEPEEN